MVVFMSVQPDWLARVQAVVTGFGVSVAEVFLKRFMKQN